MFDEIEAPFVRLARAVRKLTEIDEVESRFDLNNVSTSEGVNERMYDQVKINEVAARLEDLTVIMNQMVSELRTGNEDQPYAAVYYLRTQLSREVAKLGVGAPNIAKVRAYYESFVE